LQNGLKPFCPEIVLYLLSAFYQTRKKTQTAAIFVFATIPVRASEFPIASVFYARPKRRLRVL